MHAFTESEMQSAWNNDSRWTGITRAYPAKEVARLRGTLHIEHSLARRGAERLWDLLNSGTYINALGALTGNQAVQQVQAGLKAIYMSGWQVAGDANLAGQMYPDQSLYPSNSVPTLVRAINNALLRADQIQHSEGKHSEGKNGIHWLAAIPGALIYAPYADMLWCETSEPDMREARRFAEAIHARFPGKLLAYNCSPSFHWNSKLDAASIARFQRELGAMGYKFQFVTL